jgi:AAHS family 4-hydroxybenzoate transporter-like MFS transporter
LATSFASDRFDVAAFIDDRKLGRREVLLLFVIAAVLFIDGFDMFFFGKILPAIAEGLDVPPAAMRDVVFWTYVGMAVGAFVMPPVADRVGRRPVLALCALMFGILSFAAA